MTRTLPPDPDSVNYILDDLFFGCAVTAYIQQAVIEQSWPDSESTRKLAYRLYEEALAVKNASTGPP
jgi:hypothetical protein